MSRRVGKVRGQTPRVHTDKIPISGKPKKKKKKGKKDSGLSHHQKKIKKQMEKWEDNRDSKLSKKDRRLQQRRERTRTKESNKSSDKRRRRILSEYNDFFEFFNLPRIDDYSNLVKYIEKKEVTILVNPEERLKIANTTNWKRNQNYKLLANILSFDETHEIIRKKMNVCEFVVDNLFLFLDRIVEGDVLNEQVEEIEDNITDLIRALANLSLNETFVPELFHSHRLFTRLLTHKYFPYCIISTVPRRIQVERAKILSNLAIDQKIYQLLKQKSKLIEPLIDLTLQKGMLGEFMQILWTWVVFHEDDVQREEEKKKGEEDEDEGEEEEREKDCVGPDFQSAFVDSFIPSEHQDMIKEKIVCVCDVLEDYSENMIRIEIPETMLVSCDNLAEELKFPHSPRRTEVMMFRTVFRGRGLGGGGGKVHKPVIYMYPPEPIVSMPSVSVELDFLGGAGLPKSGLTITIPQIENWRSLQVNEGSKIRDLSTGKSYDYLFWEGDMTQKMKERISVAENMDFQAIVSKSDIPEFLRETVSSFGLVGAEIDDFLEYWNPVFKYLPHHCFEIGFLGCKKWSEYARLDIEPKPGHFVRLFMVFRGLESWSERNYSKPDVPKKLGSDAVERKGKFVVVEWGGMSL